MNLDILVDKLINNLFSEAFLGLQLMSGEIQYFFWNFPTQYLKNLRKTAPTILIELTKIVTVIFVFYLTINPIHPDESY